MDQQEQQQQEQQNQQVSSTPIVTKRETKVKNPKRVQQGKRLAEHNRKMKLQLAQMQQAEPVQDNDPKTTNAIDSRLLYAGGIVLLGGLAFLVYKRLNNEPRTPQMSPVKPRPRPPTPPLRLEMD